MKLTVHQDIPALQLSHVRANASDDSSYVNGVDFAVDGGFSAI